MEIREPAMPTPSLTRLVLTCALLCATPFALAADSKDVYVAAVANPARSDSDRKRDALDHPAEILRLAGIKPGMQVADLLAGGGYYTELLSSVVGPKGHVLMLNNAAFDGWSASWPKRVAGNRLPNVEHRTIDLNKMNLGAATLDAVFLVKVYHDLYWVDSGGDWPKVDVKSTLDQVVSALKPGGTLVIVDHSAKAGTGSSAATPLHRIDEAYAKKEFESRGLKLAAQSDVLRRPEDKRDLLSYDGPGAGKTDRFVLVFRKPAG
jgi:predicted methyltransferase